MKKAFMFLAAAFLSLCSSAQVINGDLDEDNDVTMNDAVLLVNDYVSNTRHYVKGVGSDPFAIENSAIVGKWYETKTKFITFNADGTTDYGTGYKYECYPSIGNILFFTASGAPIDMVNFIKRSNNTLVLKTANGLKMYSTEQPVQLVTGITLSSTSLTLTPNSSLVLTATVSPSDADNKAFAWSSSNESVAKVTADGMILATASGTATITATALDGSGVKATCTVTVALPSGKHNGYDWVDLGTGVKWATMNVGTSSPDDYGDYFAWGETTGYKSGKTTFDWSNYKWCKGSWDSQTKYCTDSYYGTVDNKKVLDAEDDAAHVNWGGNWRMPTKAEQDALRSQCYWKWVTTYNGKSVNGYIVYKAKADADKGKISYDNPSLVGSYSVSDPHIFIPAAGYRDGSELVSAGSGGFYWSSSLSESNPNSAYYLDFYSGLVDWYWHYYYRYYGRSVRAVCQ